jgi:hypothetical protein
MYYYGLLLVFSVATTGTSWAFFLPLQQQAKPPVRSIQSRLCLSSHSPWRAEEQRQSKNGIRLLDARARYHENDCGEREEEIRSAMDDEIISTENKKAPRSRRMALTSLLAAPLLVAASATLDVHEQVAHAYEKTFPIELTAATDGSDGRQRRVEKILEKEKRSISPLAVGPLYKPLSSVMWGTALWLLSGSRSNPVVTPLANVMYDESREEWLKDRNDGLFGDIPAPLYLVLALVFLATGFAWDEVLCIWTEGDRNLSLQLAGVSLITGASWELGRIASGEKKQTRNESNRSVQLQQEFEEFANSRLLPGGNVHRNEVVRAFRRYFAKYRQADSPVEEYVLGDLEVEQLLRAWSRSKGIKMSSAGFYTGIQINQNADVFVSRR